MNVLVLVKLVPDLVEEISIDASGTAIDTAWLRLIINEFDDHAIEQAILLKESSGSQVTIVTPDFEGVGDVLFTAAAKGADQLVKLIGGFGERVDNHSLACALTAIVKELKADLVLTGVQAHNDLDGSVGPLLAGYLGLPYIGYISSVKVSDGKAIVHKEYPGGLIAKLEVTLPAVLGIQAAEKPPRYVAVSKVRQAMKSAAIEEREITGPESNPEPAISRMYQPEAAERATIIEGDVDEVATKFVSIFKELGVF
jgi:electron transfer flavoprotein beta subunit